MSKAQKPTEDELDRLAKNTDDSLMEWFDGLETFKQIHNLIVDVGNRDNRERADRSKGAAVTNKRKRANAEKRKQAIIAEVKRQNVRGHVVRKVFDPLIIEAVKALGIPCSPRNARPVIAAALKKSVATR